MSATFSDLWLSGVPAMLWLPTAALAAVLLDRLLGELPRWHPLVGFGWLASGIERGLNRGAGRKAKGLLAWSLVVLPWVALAFWGGSTLPVAWWTW